MNFNLEQEKDMDKNYNLWHKAKNFGLKQDHNAM
jgi:hypothetical protein